MFSVSPEIYSALSVASRWLFVFFALMLLVFAFIWHRSDRRERRERFRNLPGAGTVGELVVLSGGDELPVDTWFPVPREGILGSLRSCDLVVPCPGVRSQHLDFSWQDGTGLLVRPRVGCEAFVDGTLVTRRESYGDVPLVHGSVLQVGSAVLRLQLFSALAHTNRTFAPPAPVSEPGTGSWPSSGAAPVNPVPMPGPSWPAPPAAYPPSGQMLPRQSQPGQYVPGQAFPGQAVPEQEAQRPAAPRRSRSDRWKEDWSE